MFGLNRASAPKNTPTCRRDENLAGFSTEARAVNSQIPVTWVNVDKHMQSAAHISIKQMSGVRVELCTGRRWWGKQWQLSSHSAAHTSGEKCVSAGTHRTKEKAQWVTINPDRGDKDKWRGISKVTYHSRSQSKPVECPCCYSCTISAVYHVSWLPLSKFLSPCNFWLGKKCWIIEEKVAWWMAVQSILWWNFPRTRQTHKIGFGGPDN